MGECESLTRRLEPGEEYQNAGSYIKSGDCVTKDRNGVTTSWNKWVSMRRELNYLLDNFTQAPTAAKLEQLKGELDVFLSNHQNGLGLPAVRK